MLKLISHKRLCWTRSDTLWRFVNSRPFVAPVIFILWLLYYYYSLVTWIYQSIDHLCKPMITTIKVKKKIHKKKCRCTAGTQMCGNFNIIVQYISATCSFIRRRERVIRSLNKVRFHRERKLTYLCIFIFFLDHCQTSGIDLNIIIIAYNIAAMGPRKKTSSSDAQHSMSIGNAKLVCVC